MFVGGKNKKKVSRSEKREAHYNHAKTQSIVRSSFNLDISKPELRKLQDKDPMIQELKTKSPEVIEERNGLWYHLWKSRQDPEKIVKQLLLPKQYCQVICKLAHTIPLAGHLRRDKTVKRITNQLLLHGTTGLVTLGSAASTALAVFSSSDSNLPSSRLSSPWVVSSSCVNTGGVVSLYIELTSLKFASLACDLLIWLRVTAMSAVLTLFDCSNSD